MCEYFSAEAHMIPVGSQSIPRGTQEEMGPSVTCRAIRAQERSKAIRGFRSREARSTGGRDPCRVWLAPTGDSLTALKRQAAG